MRPLQHKPLTLAERINLANQASEESALWRLHEADSLPDSEVVMRCLKRIYEEDRAYEREQFRKLRNWGILCLLTAAALWIVWAKFWPL